MVYILADNQDITRMGLEALVLRIPGTVAKTVSTRNELLPMLAQQPESVVILDYTLFDFEDIDALFVLHLRFPHVQWILFSEDLTNDIVRRVVAEGLSFSIVNKSSDLAEISEALHLAMKGERYLCRLTTEQLLSVPAGGEKAMGTLTKTEIEILRGIATGKTTKEIAAERCSSFHTVNTHRKNIFHKLDVNTAYEATRYAIRAGIIDTSDYNI